MKQIPLQKAPFVRIVVPFIIGIVCQYKIPFLPYLWIIPSILGGMFVGLFYLNKNRKYAFAHYKARPYFGIGMFFIWMVVGMWVLKVHHFHQHTPSPDYFPYLQVQLVSEPRHTNNHKLFEAVLLYAIHPDSCKNLQKQNALLYFAKNNSSQELQKGDVLLIKNDLIPIKSPGNPDEFDYAAYMRIKHTYHMQFVSDKWTFLGHLDHFSIREFSSKQKIKLQNILEQTFLTEREQDFLKAVLLGITDDLWEEQRDLYQQAGLSHLLAISGLHVGIIAFIVLWLLYPLKRLGYNRIRFFIVVWALWVYAFMCGLSPSVVRACIMFSVIMGAYLLKRQSYSVNSLAIAAFLMLVYDPYYLWDIGFQLSFLSVLLLLSAAPFFPKGVKNKVCNYIFLLIWTTTVIQIGTMALTVYYFHNIPVYSILCNLVMVPLFPVLISGGILLLLAGNSDIQPYLSDVFHFFFHQSDSIIRSIVNLPGALAENIWIDPVIVVIWLIAIFLITLWLYTQNTNYVITLLAVMSAFLFYLLVNQTKYSSEISIYNHQGGISVNVIDYPRNYVITTDELFAMESLEKVAQNHWMKIKATPPTLITDSLATTNLKVSLPFVQFGKRRILLLNDESWKNKVSSTRLKIDLLVVGREYKERIADVTPLYDIDQVVLSADVNPIVASGFEKECRSLRIKCHNTADQGAWCLQINAY